MNLWRWCGLGVMAAGLIVVVGLKFPAYAQDEKLVWKAFDLKENKVFYQKLETNTIQKMQVMNMPVEQKQSQIIYIEWTPQEKKDNNWVVKQKIIGVDMSINIGGNVIKFNSLEENQPNNPMSDFFKALLSMELTLTISPDLKVTKIEGREEFVKKLGGTNPQMEPLLKAILSEDALKQMAEPTWGAFPPADAKKGTAWKKESTLDLGPMGKYDSTFEYTFDGPDKNNLDKVNIKSTMKYGVPTKKDGLSLPFVIKDAKLSSTDGSGAAYINRKKGRIEKSDVKMKLEGSLTIDIGGMETKVDLVQEQTSAVQTLDTNPIDDMKKKK